MLDLGRACEGRPIRGRTPAASLSFQQWTCFDLWESVANVAFCGRVRASVRSRQRSRHRSLFASQFLDGRAYCFSGFPMNLIALALLALMTAVPALYQDPLADSLIRSATESTYSLRLREARAAAQELQRRFPDHP